MPKNTYKKIIIYDDYESIQNHRIKGNLRLINDGHTIGEITFIISEKQITIDGLYIRPNFRRKGFGTVLLRIIENIASILSMKTISFRVSPIDNSPEKRIKQWYVIRGYKNDKRNIMEKKI